jgi:hypothetical protein
VLNDQTVRAQEGKSGMMPPADKYPGRTAMIEMIKALVDAPDRKTVDAIFAAAGKPRTRAYDRYVRRLGLPPKKQRPLVRRGPRPTALQLAMRAAEKTVRERMAERPARSEKRQTRSLWVGQLVEKAVAEEMLSAGLKLGEQEIERLEDRLINRLKKGPVRRGSLWTKKSLGKAVAEAMKTFFSG